ncbi:hypothetical protein LSS_13554 [Leptospira santarosai serovar Shermani str. LT 821]|uniref:Uncharacterized protein n=1 Tax=Leptospira santarosai serovar Shermani str. LT 821 TaxID=758847 RepID=K8XXJ9_9LEPT|nr:hypothetical protein LSS_13554 [Leptospira santarosai serovar Shermani str. LT 821]
MDIVFLFLQNRFPIKKFEHNRDQTPITVDLKYYNI